jgi:hypothetical protein
MSSKVFEPTELFKYLKKNKGSNKRVLEQKNTSLLLKYSDLQIDDKIFEFRSQDIISYYLSIKNKKYNIINAITGLPQFYPNTSHEITSEQKITFIDDNSYKFIRHIIDGTLPSTTLLYMDLKKEHTTKHNIYYSHMYMFNIISNVALFGTEETNFEKIIDSSIRVFIKDLHRSNIDIKINKTNELFSFVQRADEPTSKMHIDYHHFINTKLPLLYKEHSNIFILQFAIHYLCAQESAAIFREIFSVIFGLDMVKLYFDNSGNKVNITVSDDGNYVSCCKIFSPSPMASTFEYNHNTFIMNNYRSCIIHNVIDCSTLNCFTKIYYIEPQQSELNKLLPTNNLSSFYKTHNLADLSNLQNKPLDSLIFPNDINISELQKLYLENNRMIALEIDARKYITFEKEIMYKFTYDSTFGYINYIDYLFKQLPGSSYYLNKLNTINNLSNVISITQLVVKITLDGFIELIKSTVVNNFTIYQIDLDNAPIYISVGKIDKTNDIIVYMCDTKLDSQIEQIYIKLQIQLKSVLSELSKHNITYTIYKQDNTFAFTSYQYSLITLITVFESITNYIVRNNKSVTTLGKPVKIQSITYKVNNFNELLETYYSHLTHFSKFEELVNISIRQSNKLTASPQSTSNTRPPRTSGSRTSGTRTTITSKTGSPRTDKTRIRTSKTKSPGTMKLKKSGNNMTIRRPRANAMRQSNAIPV